MPAKQFSSFQIAKLLNVSRQAVNQWIDKGYIESYRTPGGHRRVSREDLIEFLGARNIPVPADLDAPSKAQRVPEPADDTVNVVLIDDDEDYTTLLKQAIEDTLPKVKVRRFINAMDGLIAIGAEVPDLLLLDLRMPTMNGSEVIKRLKANARTSQLPIIVVTGVEDAAELQSIRKLKVEKILAKGKPLAELTKEIISSLIHARKSGG